MRQEYWSELPFPSSGDIPDPGMKLASSEFHVVSCITGEFSTTESPKFESRFKCQSRFDARYWILGAVALGRPRGMEWGGKREEGGGFRMGNTCIPVADSF